jgi:hypothetical protein
MKTIVKGTLMKFEKGALANDVRFIAELETEDKTTTLMVVKKKQKDAVAEANRLAKRMGWTMEKAWERI